MEIMAAKRLEIARYTERCEKSGDPAWAARWRLVVNAYDDAIMRLSVTEDVSKLRDAVRELPRKCNRHLDCASKPANSPCCFDECCEGCIGQ